MEKLPKYLIRVFKTAEAANDYLLHYQDAWKPIGVADTNSYLTLLMERI